MRVYARVCEERADCAFHGGADFDIPGGDINSGLRSWALLRICKSTEQSRPADSYRLLSVWTEPQFLGLTNRPKSLETKSSLEKQPSGKVYSQSRTGVFLGISYLAACMNVRLCILAWHPLFQGSWDGH